MLHRPDDQYFLLNEIFDLGLEWQTGRTPPKECYFLICVVLIHRCTSTQKHCCFIAAINSF